MAKDQRFLLRSRHSPAAPLQQGCDYRKQVEALFSQRNENLSKRQRALYRIMLVAVHRTAKEVVSAMYDLEATSAIYRGNPLDRIMRDIVTACQHGVVHPKMYRPAG